MNILNARRIRHFLRLTYPVRVWATEEGFAGDYPDLPGVRQEDTNLARLYASLDQARRAWITEQVLAGGQISPPNNHLGGSLAEPDSESAPAAVPSELVEVEI